MVAYVKARYVEYKLANCHWFEHLNTTPLNIHSQSLMCDLTPEIAYFTESFIQRKLSPEEQAQ